LAQQPNRPAIAFRHLGLSHNANSMTDDMAGMDAYNESEEQAKQSWLKKNQGNFSPKKSVDNCWL
jgi:hypothetical protein